ncbi:MAG: DUF4173 domain-containing protein [Candidatus Roizmanbacteria bacterium]|nr:DUF4173 domain-containing protein [Candidatus Roizmanbacteria bacterium]
MNKPDLSPRITSFLLLGVSALIPFLIIIPNYFPYLGLSITFAVLSAVVFSGVKKSRYHIALFLSALSFSLFIAIRANPFLTFLNSIAIMYTNAVLIRYQKDEAVALFSLIFSPVTVFFKSLITTHSPYALDMKHVFSKRSTGIKRYVGGNLLALGITVLVLLVIVPLLSSANPLFGRLVEDVVKLFSLERFFTFLSSSRGFMYSVRLATFFVLLVFLPRMLWYTTSQKEHTHKQIFSFITPQLLIPKVTVLFVLTVFFITQLQLYFSTEQTLLVLGYTHSQYAREVFGQLTLVTLIVFGLMYGDTGNSRLSRILTYILSIQALFLTFIAFKSDYDYSSTWGFTYKRLWGFAGVAWTFGLFSLFTRSYALQASREKFLKQAVMLTSITLIAINAINFDYVIYHYAKTTLPTGTDHYYLSYLTPDAYSYSKHLPVLMEIVQKREGDEIMRRSNVNAAQHIVYRLRNLQEMYRDIHPFAYNYAEYRTVQESKNLPLEAYQQIINEELNVLNITPFLPDPIVIEEYR